jgi:LuxR family maltose regulon positive regulatory protein
VVTPETVKKHTTHIFDKLGVANRTQAVARARELGLLP